MTDKPNNPQAYPQQCQYCIHASPSKIINKAECRKNAPFVTGGLHSSVETVWPTVEIYDWCGEFSNGSKPMLAEDAEFEKGVK